MRKIMIALAAIALFGTSTSMAQNSTAKDKPSAEVQVQKADQKEGKEIKVSELPKEVHSTLKDENYATWKPQKAWALKDNTYMVELNNGEETKKLKFKEDGSVIM